MATTAAQTSPASDPLLAKWRGLNDDEATQFVNDAIELLNDSAMVAQFEQNVGKVGTWANEVDASFDRVTRTFVRVTNESGGSFPQLHTFLAQWRGYNARWISALLLSRDVASEHVAILRRFERVFLDMVLHIQTEQDRLEVITELDQFIDEEHDNSDRMSRDFLDLSRDIDAFSGILDRFIQDEGARLDDEVRELQPIINRLKDEISVLDGQINDARIALAVSGGLLNVIGLIIAGSLLASFQNQRNAKNDQLQSRVRQMADINRRQQALAYLQTDFRGLQPDFDLIVERLLGFAAIWASVRSQSIQFRSHIQGGLDAATNIRFRREVQLAQDTCVPLRAGLERYAQNLSRRFDAEGRKIDVQA